MSAELLRLTAELWNEPVDLGCQLGILGESAELLRLTAELWNEPVDLGCQLGILGDLYFEECWEWCLDHSFMRDDCDASSVVIAKTQLNIHFLWADHPSRMLRACAERYEVIRDTELSQIPNLVPNLSRFNITICFRDAFCWAQNASNPFSAGALRLAYDAPPDPVIGWGRGYLLPIPLPLDTFGISILASLPPQKVSRISILDLWSP